MSTRTATVVPFRRERTQNIDLALSLAMLRKGVKVHERAQRTARLALLARSFRLFCVPSHAKSLGG